MSVGPLGGVVTSAAGAPLAQQGTDSERARTDANSQQRTRSSEQLSEQAAGVGETQEDNQTADRDADGRRLWERQNRDGKNQEDDDTPRSKDTTGNAGGQLDLMG